MSPRFLLLGALIATSSVLSPLRAADDPSAAMSAFIAQLQKQSTPSDSGYRQNLLGQFKALQSAIKRGEFDQAQTLLRNLDSSSYSANLPPDLQTTWSDLADKLAIVLQRQQEQAAIAWKKTVDDLVKRTAAGCLAAKTPDDLDPLLIDCSALQLRRTSQNDILSQRANQKLEAVAQTLQTWSNFLDAREGGNTQRANSILRDLTNSGSAAILTREGIEGALVPDQSQSTNPEDVLQSTLKDVRTIDQLRQACQKMEQIAASPSLQPSSDYLRREKDYLSNLIAAADALSSNNPDLAASAFQQFLSNGGNDTIRRLLGPLIVDLQRQIAGASLSVSSGEPLKSDESIGAYVKRVADGLKSAGKYAELSNFMEAVRAAGLRTPSGAGLPTPWTFADSQAVRAYTIARQFEVAGDMLPAITQYRMVIALEPAGTYAPTKEAQAALEKLKAANPEAFKDTNGAVLEELRKIQMDISQIQMQLRMPPNRPYR